MVAGACRCTKMRIRYSVQVLRKALKYMELGRRLAGL